MLSGYCAGWSLRTLLHEGLNGVPGKVEAGPPKHMSSAVGQIVNFLGTRSKQWAGAQAFSSFDTYMAPFVRKMPWTTPPCASAFRSWSTTSTCPRAGAQTPFTNLTFDWTCPDDLREQVPVIAGGKCRFAYGDLQGRWTIINRAYIDVMTTGDAKGPGVHLPHPHRTTSPKTFPWRARTRSCCST